jgi:hypothetical protein
MTDVVERLMGWSRRYEPRSVERMLMIEAANEIERLRAGDVVVREVVKEVEVPKVVEVSGDGEIRITADMVERAMGAKLFPWQRNKLDNPPPKV